MRKKYEILLKDMNVLSNRLDALIQEVSVKNTILTEEEKAEYRGIINYLIESSTDIFFKIADHERETGDIPDIKVQALITNRKMREKIFECHFFGIHE